MKKIVLAFAVVSTLPGFAQKAFNKLTFTKGQQLEVVTNINLSAESMMGPTTGTITIADLYSVNNATAQTTTLLKVPKQVKMNFNFGSQEIKLDSDNPKDLSSPFSQPVKEIMSQKPEFTIDASGKILSVKKNDTKTKAEGDGAGMMGMMLPGMDFASAVPQPGAPSFFQVLPNREVGIGDTWTDSLQAEGTKNVTVYKVKDISDKEIVLDFSGAGTTVTAREAMGMNVNVNAANRSTGSIVLDKATGIIKQKTTTNTTETTMNMGGREITSTIKTTMVTNVKPS
ncbi:DUF6263 family protein [Flavisolibacter nicotianae]|uniref:DUF6263 family protein n=1 Tax=Flavisolibacter nicotianae TaxID=2364882 RepID=UPI000EB13FAE|nr:DUF6263 family protein [Flavisolibacter nicotianae]